MEVAKGPIIRMFIGLLLVLIGLVIIPIIMDQIPNITGHTDISDFPGTASLANLFPLLLTAGLLISGGFMFWTGLKSARN